LNHGNALAASASPAADLGSTGDRAVSPFAPIIVFAYARRDHLQRCIESLAANPEAASSDLVIHCDAAKKPEHQAQVDDVRRFVESIGGFRSVTRRYRQRNAGLATSVIEGVSEVLSTRSKVIVVEDDLVLSPHFLRYMNEALEKYETEDRVASVHGYVYPTKARLPETFFLVGADCWGWATWSRAWKHFNPDGTSLLEDLKKKNLCRHFDFDYHYPYTTMLKDQIAGLNSSWAILWHASCYLQGLLTLYPGRSLVENNGNDSSGTHCGTSESMATTASEVPVRIEQIPLEPSREAWDAFSEFFKDQMTWKLTLRRLVKRAAPRRLRDALIGL
jgi:hypothetical protein